MGITVSSDYILDRVGLTYQAQELAQKTEEFSAALRQELQSAVSNKQEILDSLSEHAKATLDLLKNSGDKVQEEDWLALLEELKDTGAISESDFTYTRTDLQLIPIPAKKVDGKFVQLMTEPVCVEGSHFQIPEALRGLIQWPCDPLNMLDQWELLLKKWKGNLMVDCRGQLGCDMAAAFSGVDAQAAACSKVAQVVRALIA